MPQVNSIMEMAHEGQTVAGIARDLAINEKAGIRQF